MKNHRFSSAVAVVMLTMTAATGAEDGGSLAALRAEAERLREELVLLRHIRTAQRELIEWTQISEAEQVAGLPAEICDASALRGLCSRLALTFSTREEES